MVENCSCPNVNCPRHGKCEECVAFHREGGKKPPVCLRIEWTEF